MDIPIGNSSGLHQPMALFRNITLAGVLLCCSGNVPNARAQMHLQSFELTDVQAGEFPLVFFPLQLPVGFPLALLVRHRVTLRSELQINSRF
jgi:hypothetical protein